MPVFVHNVNRRHPVNIVVPSQSKWMSENSEGPGGELQHLT